MYNPCDESLKGLHPPKIHHIHSTSVYRPCNESWEGLHPPKIHCIEFRLVYSPCDESLEGVHRARIHRIHPRPVYSQCDESLEGLHPSMIHRIHPLPFAEPHPLLPPPLHRPNHLPLLNPLWIRHPHWWACGCPSSPFLTLTRLQLPLPGPPPFYLLLFFYPSPLRRLSPSSPCGLPLTLARCRLLFLRRLRRLRVDLLHLA